jgi:hypothetical protein
MRKCAAGLLGKVVLRQLLCESPDETVTRRVRDRVMTGLEVGGRCDGLGARERAQMLVAERGVAVHGQRTRRTQLRRSQRGKAVRGGWHGHEPRLELVQRPVAPLIARAAEDLTQRQRMAIQSHGDRLRRLALRRPESPAELLLGDRCSVLGRQALQADRRGVKEHTRSGCHEKPAARRAEHQPLRRLGRQVDVLERKDRAPAAQQPFDAQVASLHAALVELVKDGVQQIGSALAATVEVNDPVAHRALAALQRRDKHVRLAHSRRAIDVDDAR